MDERLSRARIALEGLSVGDSFGEKLASQARNLEHIVTNRIVPDGVWAWTDDTNMALSIYENLRKYGEIVQTDLAQSFAKHFDWGRGYGMGAARLLSAIQSGYHWQEISPQLFGGKGSYGNGAAMRIAPLGAFFADDMDALIENAQRSSVITHTHPEGIAGAIAVAVGAAIAWQHQHDALTSDAFLSMISSHIPESTVKNKVEIARTLPKETSLKELVAILGNGSLVSAQDTVPLVLWMSAHYLKDFEAALWHTALAAGDIDTTCAMVGGIVACAVGVSGIPREWIMHREPLPTWPFEDE